MPNLFTPFDASAANEQLQGQISSGNKAIRQGVAVGETAAIGYGFKKFSKAKFISKFFKKLSNVKDGLINKIGHCLSSRLRIKFMN